MIIITDSHVHEKSKNMNVFFQMLEKFENNNEDILFIGDIFDLWIAIRRFEKDIHKTFLNWCLNQKKNRTIGFIEGNHEFFLAEKRSNCFTWSTNEPYWKDNLGNLFTHGDEINSKDKLYFLFKKFFKNKISKKIIYYTPPIGPNIADSIKYCIKKMNSKFKNNIPHDIIIEFGKKMFSEGINRIFTGHFHNEKIYDFNNDKKIYSLPDWKKTQKVTLFNKNENKVSFIHWKNL